MDSACHYGRDDDHPRRADRRGQHLHFRSRLDGDHRGQRHGPFQEKDGCVRLYVRHHERGGAARQPLGDDDRDVYKRQVQSHVIAMQGPFSRNFNAALYDQLRIRTMVSKDSGQPGGVADKVLPALERGIDVVMIERPKEDKR